MLSLSRWASWAADLEGKRVRSFCTTPSLLESSSSLQTMRTRLSIMGNAEEKDAAPQGKDMLHPLRACGISKSAA